MSSKRARIAGYFLGLFIVFTTCPILEVLADDTVETDGEPKPAAEDKPSKLKTIAGYGLSIAGSFVVIAIVFHTLSKTLQYEQARNAIVHLLRSNPNQAELQCATLPHSFYDAVGATLKVGGMTGPMPEVSVLQQATVPTWDAIAAQVIQHWKGLLGKAKLATAAAGGAIILATGVLTVVLGVVAVGGLLWLMFYKSEVERSLFRAKVEVLPEIEAAFVQGRYYIQPRA